MTIYVVSRYIEIDRVDVLETGFIGTEKRRADEFFNKNTGPDRKNKWRVVEVDDGEEWPQL